MDTSKPIYLSSYEFNQQSHQFYAQLRQEAPVYKARMNFFQPAYVVSRYEDVVNLIKDPRIAKDAKNAKKQSGRSGEMWVPRTFRPLLQNMLNTDEPDHRRQRNLVHKAFTPRRIAELQPRIEEIADQLLDAAVAKSSFDLVSDFALPLPVTVIAELIGIPVEDRPTFLRMAQGILVNPTPLNMMKAIPHIRRFLKYTRRLAQERRANPQDDLLTGLVQAEDEGDNFTEDELVGMVFLLLVAGHETTVSLIANGALALLDNPEQLQRLRDEPELIDSAVEELLRYDGPLQTTEMSYAREPIELHGTTIPQGAIVLPSLLSANRDESVFDSPNELDLGRTPNKHVAFGLGIHYCLGAPLARMEGRLAISKLFNRAPNLRLAVPRNEIQYRGMMLIHRLDSLPVSV